MTALLAFLSLLIATPDLTKEEVKRLVAAGISDDVIVEYIRANGPVQPLTAQDLIDLRQANVSEKVLAAMMQPSRTPETAPSQSQDYATGGSYSSYYSYPWYYPYAYSYYSYYPGPYVYPYYYSYPYYHYHYPYYYRPYYYGYPYRYPYPYSVHNYRNHTVPHMSAPAPPHPSPTYRGHR